MKDHFDGDDGHHWKGVEGRNLYTVGVVKYGKKDPNDFAQPHVFKSECKDSYHGGPGRSLFNGKSTPYAPKSDYR